MHLEMSCNKCAVVDIVLCAKAKGSKERSSPTVDKQTKNGRKLLWLRFGASLNIQVGKDDNQDDEDDEGARQKEEEEE